MKSPQELSKAFNQYLSDMKFNGNPDTLYDPYDYMMRLGGKRMRPVFLLLGYQLCSDTIENAFSAAMSVEVFHNFSLIHDDIMDESDIRRGQQTAHLKYGTNTAILSGDLMMIKAIQCFNGYDDKLYPIIVKDFLEMGVQLCEGQQMDMDFETQDDVSIADYLQMIRYKTAVLPAVALKIGAILGNAPQTLWQPLYDFAINIGLAFQIMDDYLDTFGTQEMIGKRVGGDILNNKKTFLYLKALELTEGTASNQKLKELFATKEQSEAKINEVTAIYNEVGLKAVIKNIVLEYNTKAYVILDKMDLNAAQKESLKTLAELLAGRSY